MGFYYRDLDARPPKRRVPRLKKLENRMYNSLLQITGSYVRKHWLAGRSSKNAFILQGTKKEDPMSGDIRITLETLVVPLESEVYDPLGE